MLTKDLIRFKKRKGRIYPDQVELDCPNSLDQAIAFANTINQSKGLTQADLLSTLEERRVGDLAKWNALKKIALDKIKWSEPDSQFYKSRIEIILQAQQLRCENLFDNPNSYHETISSELDEQANSVCKNLYQDLPQNLRVLELPSKSPSEWLEMYNFSQIQSLLLRANQVKINFSNLDTASSRKLIQLLKFNRLLATWTTEGSSLTAEVTGPNQITGSTQSYGLSFAKLLTVLKSFTNWQAEFEIKINTSTKPHALNVSSSASIGKSTLKGKSHIPKEFDLLLKASMDSSLPLRQGSCHLTLPGEATIVPDFELINCTSHAIYIEIFHRWHHTGLKKRLQDLEHIKQDLKFSLLIGVDRQLLTRPEIKSAVEDSKYFTESGFLFRDFPTFSAVQKVIKKNLLNNNFKCSSNSHMMPTPK